MDIYSFINSTAMQDYLRKINYKFSGFEAAWLIYRSNRATLAEKHAAWQEIIDTWPDEESGIPIQSISDSRTKENFRYKLHHILKDQIYTDIALITHMIDNYPKENNKYVYRCFFGITWNETYFSSYKEAYNFAIDKIKKSPKYTKFTIVRELSNVREVTEDYINITFSRNGEIMSVKMPAIFEVKKSALENLLFEFPTPFKKGDILYNPYEYPDRISTPFVFIESVSSEEVIKMYDDFDYPDGSKNAALIYIVCGEGKIEKHYFGEYTSFEYCLPEKIDSKTIGMSDSEIAVLKVLSKYLKSDDDPDSVKFAQEYAQTIAKGWANEILK